MEGESYLHALLSICILISGISMAGYWIFVFNFRIFQHDESYVNQWAVLQSSGSEDFVLLFSKEKITCQPSKPCYLELLSVYIRFRVGLWSKHFEIRFRETQILWMYSSESETRFVYLMGKHIITIYPFLSFLPIVSKSFHFTSMVFSVEMTVWSLLLW